MVIDLWNSLSTLGAVIGVTSMVGLILMAVFAPAMISVIAEWLKALSPLVRAIGEGIVWFFNTMWEGFKDMMDNAASVVFVIVCILVGGWFISSARPCKVDSSYCDRAVQRAISDLRKDYKFVPRTPTEKKAYKKQTQPTTTFKWFWE